MEAYRGYKRFINECSKKTDAVYAKVWFLVFITLMYFSLIFFICTDKNKLSNTGVMLISKLLTKTGKGEVPIRYYDAFGIEKKIASKDLIKEKYIQENTSSVVISLWIGLLTSLILSLLTLWFLGQYFKKYHEQKRDKKTHLRGAKYKDSEAFLKEIQKQKIGSVYPLVKIPWVLEKVKRHLSISGDTGVGKSQALMKILEVIRRRKEKAFILDKNGEILSHFYNPETDIILSPFDDRSMNWTPYLEGMEEVDLERMAMSFIPTENTKGDAHWPEASVTVFSALLYQVSRSAEFSGRIDDILIKLLERTKTVEENLLGKSKEVVKYGLLELVEGTLASLVIDPGASEHAKSVIASIVPKIRSLRYLRGLEGRGDFSIRDWVRDDKQTGWVFIRVNENEMDVVSSLVTAWFDTFIKSVLSLAKSDERVIWNVIDELQSLSKINTLSKALSEGRKHGLRNILGFTSIDELFETYGAHKAKAMMSQCNTKLVFQTAEYGAAKWNSELLGMEEVITESESQTFGERDSQGVSDQRNEKAVVMASEIQNLEGMKAYLKFSGDYPTTQTSIVYEERPVVAEISVPRAMPPPLLVEQKIIRPPEKVSRVTPKNSEPLI